MTIIINKAVKNTRAYGKAQYFFVGTFILIGVVAIGTIYNNNLLCNLNNNNSKTNIEEIKKNIQEINTNTEEITKNIEEINTNTQEITKNIQEINTNLDDIKETIHNNIKAINTKIDLLILSNKKIIYMLESKITVNPFLTNSPLFYLNESDKTDKSDPPSERISETNMNEDEGTNDYEFVNDSYDALPCNNIKLTGIMKE